MQIGDRVKTERAVRGWTQRELGQRAGISKAYIAQLEQNKRPNPSGDTLHKLASAFGIGVEQLRQGIQPLDTTQPPVDALTEEGIPPSEIMVLIQAWVQLTPEDREAALAFLRSMAARRHAKDQNPAQNHKPQTHPATG